MYGLAHTVTGGAGLSDTCTAEVTLADTTPPTIERSGLPIPGCVVAPLEYTTHEEPPDGFEPGTCVSPNHSDRITEFRKAIGSGCAPVAPNAVDLSSVHFRRSSANPLAYVLPAYPRLCRSWIRGAVVFDLSDLLKQLREQIQRPLRVIGH